MRVFVLAFLLSLFLFQDVSFAGRDKGLEPAKYFFIPNGNPEQGKKAFVKLKCTACHQTADHASATPPVADKIGPTLGMIQAEYPSGWIANSIVSPSHTIALDSDGQSDGGELSRMPDFTNVMTVRQLIDIIAYIKSQGDIKS